MAVQRLLQPEIPNSKLQDQAVSVITVDGRCCISWPFHCSPIWIYFWPNTSQHSLVSLCQYYYCMLLLSSSVQVPIKSQKCILIWPQLVKVVSDEANRSTCGRRTEDWQATSHGCPNPLTLISDDERCATTMPKTKRPLRVPKAIKSSHSSCGWSHTTRLGGTSHEFVMMNHESWDVMRCHEMSWDVMRCHEMSWDVMRCHEMSWDVMRCHEMSWDKVFEKAKKSFTDKSRITLKCGTNGKKQNNCATGIYWIGYDRMYKFSPWRMHHRSESCPRKTFSLARILSQFTVWVCMSPPAIILDWKDERTQNTGQRTQQCSHQRSESGLLACEW